MSLIIKQKDLEVLEAIQTLCKTEKTNLENVAQKMGLTYQKLYHRLRGKMVEVELINEIVKAIQGEKKGRRVSLINYSEITIVSSKGLRINLVKHE